MSKLFISDLKKQAREIARASDASYCQALASLARNNGFPNWDALVASTKKQSSIEVPPELARRSHQKLNAFIADALDHASKGIIPEGLRTIALDAVFTDVFMDYEQRHSTVLAVLRGIHQDDPDRPRKTLLDIAAHLVAAIAHNVLLFDDWRMAPELWSGRPVCIEMIRDAASEMHTAHLTMPGMAKPMMQASAWSYFNNQSIVALSNELVEASRSFAVATALKNEDQQVIEHLVISLADPKTISPASRTPIPADQIEEALTNFIKMIVERYMIRAGGHGSDYFETARVNLDVYLADEEISFGDPSRPWNRDLANQIADADMEVWADNI